jgi:putative ABC transport system permease protein
MNLVALQMLVGDRARYIGILIGLTFASLLITQQGSIFVGLMTRATSFVRDAQVADIWIMDPSRDSVVEFKNLQSTMPQRVRSIEGVQWAVPMFRSDIPARLPDGRLTTITLVGVDDSTLIGLPSRIVSGSALALRNADSVLVDDEELGKKLGVSLGEGLGKRPLALGERIEINDRVATVAGTFKVNRQFFFNPNVYTTFSRAKLYAPRTLRSTSYVLVKVAPGHEPGEVARRIREATGQRALTSTQWAWQNISYVLENTGIGINFGIAVGLGFIVGMVITGQTFYNFTVDNLRYFGTLKAMGTGNWTLVRMVVLQALLVGAIGYGLGVGAATLFGKVTGSGQGQLAFSTPWQLLAITAGAVTFVCLLSALLSVRKVLALEPAVVFKG